MLAVRRSGARIRVDHLDVRALSTTRGAPRVGIVVPRYKHTAVDRNRLKRRLRELARRRLLPGLRSAAGGGVGAGVDVVVWALPAAYEAHFDALAAQVDRLEGLIRRRLALA